MLFPKRCAKIGFLPPNPQRGLNSQWPFIDIKNLYNAWVRLNIKNLSHPCQSERMAEKTTKHYRDLTRWGT